MSSTKKPLSALAILVTFSLAFVGVGVGVAFWAPASLGPMGGAIAGGEDPATYRPALIAPESTDGFGAGEEIKTEFVLVSVAAELVEETLAVIPEAVVIYPATSGTAVVAVPRDQQDLVPTSSAVVENNQPVGTFSTEFVETVAGSWGVDRIDQASLPLDGTYRYVSSGSGIRIYVVDTGVNTSHSVFSGRIATGFSAINDGRGVEDCNGHGTHVAGSAAGSSVGVAQQATIVPVRVLNCDGSGFGSDVLAGLDWIVKTHPGGPAVINLSLGGPYSAVLNAAVENAVSRGFIVVAAAGNSSSDACSVSPVSAGGVIGVGASTQSDNFASFSNFGSCVDTVAPGAGIVSSWIGSGSATASLSGTSMASPHVAGMAARLMQRNPGIGASGILGELSGQENTASISDAPAGTSSLLAAWEEVIPEEELAEEELDEELTEEEGEGNSARPVGPPGQAQRDAAAQRAPGLSDTRGPERATEAPGRALERALPGRPSALRIAQASDSSVRVAWAAVNPADSVTVSWWPRTSPTSVQSVTLSGGATSHVIEGLQPAVMYEVSVSASITAEGKVLQSQPTQGSFLIPPANRPTVPTPGNPAPRAPEPGVEESSDQPTVEQPGRPGRPGNPVRP
jgi:subtilisin family serine protease